MTRIAELQKKYPSIHKEIVVKWEATANGIKDTKDLDKLSKWTTASTLVYASEDEDLTLQRLKELTPWRFQDNRVLLPRQRALFTGEIGSEVDLHRKNRAILSVREISEGEFVFFEGEERIDVEVFPGFWPWPRVGERPDLVTSKGTPVRDLLWMCCPSEPIMQPTQFCEFFNSGRECRFCNYNPSYADARNAGLTNFPAINPDELAEAIKIYDSEVHWINNGLIVGGAFKTPEQGAKVDIRFVEKIAKAIPRTSYLKLATTPMSRKNTQRLKDVGLTGLRFQMETFDERLFPTICPGKASHTAREGWLEACQEAVEIFGPGNVATKLVGGVTMQGTEGYATWQEARDSHIEGDRWLISHGVYPCMQPLRWAPGSPFSEDPANREKFPPTEFYLDVILAHHAVMKEFGLYQKMNPYLYCTLMGIEHVANTMDLGIAEIAGDCGKWNARHVPYEENYIAQLLDAHRSRAKTKSSASK